MCESSVVEAPRLGRIAIDPADARMMASAFLEISQSLDTFFRVHRTPGILNPSDV